MSTKHRVRACAAAVVLLFCVSWIQPASADQIDKIAAEAEGLRQQAEALGPQYLKTASYKSAQYVSERLIDGENFYRTKDYQRAAVIFMDIIENFANHSAYADALYLYADSLFMARDYLGARDWFQRVLSDDKVSGQGRFRQKAIERLIEIGIHLGDFEGIDQYFNQLGGSSTAETRYVRAKYLYFKGNLEDSRKAFESVNGDELLNLKALYMTAVVLTRQGKFDQAIEIFKRGQSYIPKTHEEKDIVDLMNLGAGRLFYEQGFVIQASEAYQRIAQNSPHFDSALYEAASVLIRAGDTIRAEQTLEVLTVAVPDSKYVPRAKMLRGNLLLRTGRYDDAERVFEEVIAEFTPVMNQLDGVIQSQQDTRKFFSELVEKNLETLDVSGVLPPILVKWVSEEEEVKRALNVAGDLGVAKEYVRETERLVQLLEAVIEGTSSVNAVPSLRHAMRRGQQISNQIARLRVRLLRIAEDKYGATMSQIAAIRTERQELEKQLVSLPTDINKFKEREKESRKIYVQMRKELSRGQIRIDQLSAMTVAIGRFISDPQYIDGVSDDKIKTVTEELRRHRMAIQSIKNEMAVLRTDVESGRYQVGIGDARDKQDAQIREKIRNLAAKERSLLASRSDDGIRRIEKAHKNIDNVDVAVSRFTRDVESEADRQVRSMRDKVRNEKDRVAGYGTELKLLEGRAEEVVGGVTFENFSNVRKRFHDLVLKADVGIIDVAWLKKEEHTSRIGELTKGRLNEIRTLDDEFHEVKEINEN